MKIAGVVTLYFKTPLPPQKHLRQATPSSCRKVSQMWLHQSAVL